MGKTFLTFFFACLVALAGLPLAAEDVDLSVEDPYQGGKRLPEPVPPVTAPQNRPEELKIPVGKPEEKTTFETVGAPAEEPAPGPAEEAPAINTPSPSPATAPAAPPPAPPPPESDLSVDDPFKGGKPPPDKP